MPGEFTAVLAETKSLGVFLSFGKDAVELRDRVESVLNAANSILISKGTRVRIEVRHWNLFPAHRSHRTHINDEFIDAAMNASMIVALLINDIRPGTFKELTAVLKKTKHNVAVLIFKEPKRKQTKELKAFLKKWGTKIQYTYCGPASDDKSWIEIIKVLVDVLLRIVKSEGAEGRDIFYENRTNHGEGHFL